MIANHSRNGLKENAGMLAQCYPVTLTPTFPAKVSHSVISTYSPPLKYVSTLSTASHWYYSQFPFSASVYTAPSHPSNSSSWGPLYNYFLLLVGFIPYKSPVLPSSSHPWCHHVLSVIHESPSSVHLNECLHTPLSLTLRIWEGSFIRSSSLACKTHCEN